MLGVTWYGLAWLVRGLCFMYGVLAFLVFVLIPPFVDVLFLFYDVYVTMSYEVVQAEIIIIEYILTLSVYFSLDCFLGKCTLHLPN